jgi:hypothetical protein
MRTLTDFIDTALTAYVECALWSSTADVRDLLAADLMTAEDAADYSPEDSLPLDDFVDAGDLTVDAMGSMESDVRDFVSANWDDVRTLDAAQVGHDFWLTRNRHGAGFWDRGLGELGDRLTAVCRPYGGSDLYIGDDGAVYVS